MNIEIERKFLVEGRFKKLSYRNIPIRQGYISTDPERVVRIRITDRNGFITIKGASDAKGLTRMEWEREITIDDANQLIALCRPHIIEKVRYLVKHGSHIVEVDEFLGVNRGLVLAEIEMHSDIESVELPNWIGAEVTGDPKYYNSYISKYPYSDWK